MSSRSRSYAATAGGCTRGVAAAGVRGLVAALAVALAAQLLPLPAAAQEFRFVPTFQPELVADVTAGNRTIAFAGVGLNRPAGYYVRAGGSLAAGRELGSNPGNVVRAEITARFLADPFAEGRWGPYAGGGVAVDGGEGRRASTALMLFVGTQFPGRTGWRPAVEIGFGGGVRLAVVFRRARSAGR